MRTIELDITQIESNPKNYRRTYQGIEKLADSIYRYGLLQNLVLIEYQPGKYHVHAGERRYRAIRMLCQQNDHSGNPRWTGPVHCVVVTQFGLEDVVENEERMGVAFWQSGARYAVEYEQNVDQSTIAVKVGKSQSHISLCLRFHYGLATKVQRMLDKIGPDALTIAQLEQLIRLKDGDSPDEERQVQKCIEFLGKDRTKRKSLTSAEAERTRMLDRVARLERKQVPVEHERVFNMIVDYLHGRSKRLRF